MPLCEVNPLLPMIGIVLSALAVLATIKLLLRLMTLETREVILEELAQIDDLQAPVIDAERMAQQTTEGEIHGDQPGVSRSVTWWRHCRLLLLVPSFVLVLGFATVLYLTTIDDCEAIDRDAGGAVTM